MTLRNLRAYTQNKDDTLSTVTPSDYETGNGANARLRKINLNVDIATQAELNEAFNLLSNAIEDISTGTLSNYYTKPEANEISTALSTALTGEIDAEATARKEADNAIKASLSAYALSTTVADAYKLSVSDPADQTSSFVYTIMQGEREAGTINVPKDMFVEGASFQGTVLVLSVRGQDTPISTDLSGLVDVYTGGSTTDAVVSVDKDTNVITVTATDAIARVGTSTDTSSANTIYGAKAYADEVAAAVAVSAEGETDAGALVSADDANNMITVGSTQKLKDAVAAAENAISSVVGDNTYLTATTNDHAVTVSATNKLTAVVNTVETSASVWDTVTNKADLTALTSEETARTNADEFLSGKIDALSSSLNAAEGDEYISAYVDGNTVKVEALCATVWNEVSAKIDTSKVVAAANKLSVLAPSALEDYQDIDMIISEVEKIKGALCKFYNSVGGVTPPPTPPSDDEDPTKTYFYYNDGTRSVLADSSYEYDSEEDKYYDFKVYLDTDARGQVLMTPAQYAAVSSITIGTNISKLDGILGYPGSSTRNLFLSANEWDDYPSMFPNLKSIKSNIAFDNNPAFDGGSIVLSKLDQLTSVTMNVPTEMIHCNSLDNLVELNFNSDLSVYPGAYLVSCPSVSTVNLLSGNFYMDGTDGSGWTDSSYDLTSLTIPAVVNFDWVFIASYEITLLRFIGRTKAQVKALNNYPWGYNTFGAEHIIECSDGRIIFDDEGKPSEE